MNRQKHFKAFCFLFLFCMLVSTNANSQFKLQILHNNDGESKLVNAGVGVLQDFGGVARFKTLLDTLRAQGNAQNIPSIMLSSGDNFLAGPEFYLSQQLPYGTPFYDVLAMNSFDYDAICIGNHEFDFGPDLLARFIREFQPLPQAPWLSANLGFAGEDSLAMLYNTGRIKPSVVLNVNGTQVGIVAVTTPRLPSISSPGNVTVDTAIVSIVQSKVDSLTNAGVKIIIFMGHLQTIQEDTALARRISGVDLMIAGGGSEVLANPGDLLVPGDVVFGSYPLMINNLQNIPTPIITTEGNYKYIGKLICEFDNNGDLISVDTSSGPVRVSGGAYPDAVMPNTQLQNDVVNPVQAGLNSLANNIIAQSNVPLDGVRNNVRSKETNLGDLIADAFKWKANELITQSSSGILQVDVALQNGGGIRNNSVIPAGNISELNAFSILPFANFLSVVPNVPRTQFKEIMENAVSRVAQFDGRFAQISGFKMQYNVMGVAQVVDNAGNVITPGSRIVRLELDNGTMIVENGVVIPGADITIATLNFLANGGDQYPFRGLPFISLPVSYTEALIDYIDNGNNNDSLNGVIDSTMYPINGLGRIIRFDNPLPVELNSFSSNVTGNDVTLLWSTSVEINNSGFEIERRSNSQNWNTVGFVTGSGTTNETKNYVFTDRGLTRGNFSYRLKQIDFNGNFEYFNLSNEVIIGVPEKFSLSQNFPNPFNPSTRINFDIPVNSFITLKVYDVLGNEVKTLVNENKTAGSYSIDFNAADLSSGIYIYKLNAQNFSSVKKMTLLK